MDSDAFLHEMSVALRNMRLADRMVDVDFLCEMAAAFQNMKEAEEMVDVELVFEETRVKCHRLVLAASSQFFRRMFQTDMRERDAKEIAIKEVSSSTGRLLVDYLYSGCIAISTENAQELLAVSDRLLVTKLKENVEDFLRGQIESSNCVSLLNLSRLHNLTHLMKDAQEFLTDHWKELLKAEEIEQLTEDDLVSLITAYDSDEDSFRLLQKWTRSSEGRNDRFMDLLQNLRIAHFSKEFVCETVMSEELVQNPRGREIIEQAVESLMRLKQHSLVVGNGKDIWFSEDFQKWEQIKDTPCECVLSSTCSSPNGFIVSGGLKVSGFFNFSPLLRECYEYKAHARKWRRLPPMSEARCNHASLCDEHTFMVVSGDVACDSSIKSVECLNLGTLKWSHFPPLPLALSRPKAVYVKHKLFVLGVPCSSPVYEFDSAARSWLTRCPMPGECTGGGAVSFNNKIFVVGGKPTKCLQYDPCSDAWTKLQRPPFQRFSRAAVEWRGKILVCGAEDNDCIEEYDPQLDKWSTWDLQLPSQEIFLAVMMKGIKGHESHD